MNFEVADIDILYHVNYLNVGWDNEYCDQQTLVSFLTGKHKKRGL